MLDNEGFLILLQINDVRIPKTKLGRKLFEHRWAEVYEEYCAYMQELKKAKPTVAKVKKELEKTFPETEIPEDLFNIATENLYFPDNSPSCIKVVLHIRKKGVQEKLDKLLSNKVFSSIGTEIKPSYPSFNH